MQEDSTPALNRRRLLRRASTVAAGLGAAGVATAMTAAPAHAAGEVTISGDSSTVPALTVKNTSTGPALLVQPTAIESIVPTAPVGTVFIDGYGDVNSVGHLYGPSGTVGDPYVNMLYSPTWATMVIPTTAFRFYDSWLERNDAMRNQHPDNAARRLFGNIVQSLTPTGTDGGQVKSTSLLGGANLVLDFSEIFVPNDGVMAVQANFTVVGTGNGFGGVWGEGDAYPGSSSINYIKGVPIANFTQTVLDDELKMRIKVQSTARVIIDVVGFVVNDPATQFNLASAPAAAKAAQRRYMRRPAPGGR